MLKNGHTGYFLLCRVGTFMPDVRDKTAAYETRQIIDQDVADL